MKSFKIISCTLLVLLALGALTASMALAEEGLLPTGAAASGSATTTTFETAAGKISCKEVKILSLQWLAKSAIHGTTDLHLTGCKAQGLVPINTLGDASEIILAKSLYLFCLVTPTSLTSGILLQWIANVHLEIPATKELLLVRGVAIAKLVTMSLKGKEFEYSLVGSKGVQTTATECKVGTTTVKHSLELSANGGAFEATSQNGPFRLVFEKEVELMDT